MRQGFYTGPPQTVLKNLACFAWLEISLVLAKVHHHRHLNNQSELAILSERKSGEAKLQSRVSVAYFFAPHLLLL